MVVLALGMWNVLEHTEAVRLYLLAAVALGLSCSAGPQPFCPAAQASLTATARVRTSWELISGWALSACVASSLCLSLSLA